MDLNTIAGLLQPELLRRRGEMHIHPETRYDTVWTRQYIESEFTGIMLHLDLAARQRWTHVESKGGIIVRYTKDPSLKTIALRADFDALPVSEDSGLSIASLVPGKSHACGHDAHTATLLTLIQAITDNRIEPAYNLVFLFEDAEENPDSDPDPMPGSYYLVKDGALDGVDAVFSMHYMADREVGTIHSRPGPIFGQSGRGVVTVTTKGGHVAMPHESVSARRVMHDIESALLSVRDRFVSPFDPVAIEFAPSVVGVNLVQLMAGLKPGTGSMSAGEMLGVVERTLLGSSNVVPGYAVGAFGLRHMLDRTKATQLRDEIIREVDAVSARYDVVPKITMVNGHDTTINDPTVYQRVKQVVEKAGLALNECAPELGGESAGRLQVVVPGCYVMIGAGGPGKPTHHSSKFVLDPAAFVTGLELEFALVTSPETLG